MATHHPDPFLEVRTQFLGGSGPVTTLCSGYESGRWRSKQLAKNIFEWLPFVALDQESQLAFAAHNFLELLERACKHVYETQKKDNRGELGEVLLHIACIERFNAYPVLCKLILKTAPNDTVKGFDGIYIVSTNNDFEIWLGESKFYRSANRAVKDAVQSIRTHILPHFISAEKAMVTAHIENNTPFYESLKTILKQKTSADILLKKAVFPILIAYNSTACSQHTELSNHYVKALSDEVSKVNSVFEKRAAGMILRFNLIFVPLCTKQHVVDEFDKLLRPFV